MRFEGLELPKCSYWLERLNILFLIDTKNNDVPFISSSVAPDDVTSNDTPCSLQIIKNMLYPEDIKLFEKHLNVRKNGAMESNLRLRNKNNKPVSIRLNLIKTGPGKKRRLLIALPG